MFGALGFQLPGGVELKKAELCSKSSPLSPSSKSVPWSHLEVEASQEGFLTQACGLCKNVTVQICAHCDVQIGIFPSLEETYSLQKIFLGIWARQ